jgi:hypothetical protein
VPLTDRLARQKQEQEQKQKQEKDIVALASEQEPIVTVS